MKKIVLGAFLGIGLLLFIPWVMNQIDLDIEVKGSQGQLIAWQLFITFEGFLYGFITHWILRARRDKKTKEAGGTENEN